MFDHSTCVAPGGSGSRVTPELQTALPQSEDRLQVRLVLTDVLVIERPWSAVERRCPAQIPAGHLVAGFLVGIDGLAGIVLARHQVPERVPVAVAVVAAPLRGTCQAKLDGVERLGRDTQAKEMRVIDVLAVPLEHAIEAIDRPWAEPRQPARFKRLGILPVERERGNRAGVVAEDVAALPAGPPPALEIARGQHPVAERHADVAAVGPHRLAVACVRNDGSRETHREPIAQPLVRAFELALLARHGLETCADRSAARSRPRASQSCRRSLDSARALRRTRSSAANAPSEGFNDVGTLSRSRAICGHDIGHTVTGMVSRPSSTSNSMSCRSPTSPGSSHGEAATGRSTTQAPDCQQYDPAGSTGVSTIRARTARRIERDHGHHAKRSGMSAHATR